MSEPGSPRSSLPLEAVLEHAHEAFVSIDEDGRVVAWNPEAERTFGWSKEQAIGALLRDLIIPPQHRADHDRGLVRFRETGHGNLVGKRIEITALHRNGNEFPVELTISPLRGTDDEPWTFHAFVHDISDRYRSYELQRHLATIVEHSIDAIITRTRDGLVTTWNPAAERLFGYTAAEMIGRRVDVLEPPHRRGEAAELLARAVAGEEPAPFETERCAKDGTLLDVSLTLSPIRDDAGEVTEIAMSVRDVRARKRAEREFAEAAELRAQFVAVASHELRTPLTSISGFTTTLLERWETLPDEQRLEFLRIIHDQSERLVRLVNNVLLLSRLDAGAGPREPRTVDLARVARAAVEELGAPDVVVVDGDGPVLALADPDDVHRMLLNYIVNALAHGSPPVRVETRLREEWVEAVVSDGGEGVAPEHVPALFTAYTQIGASAGSGGAGLGLAIVKALAEANGGSAWYEGGARFGVRLPAAR